MSNIKQNNEVESINKEISLVKDRLKINEKSLNQFQNGLRLIWRLQIKQGKKTNLFKTKKKFKKHWGIYLILRLRLSKKGWFTKKCACKCTK